MIQEWPKWVTHISGKRQVVASKAEYEALGADWFLEEALAQAAAREAKKKQDKK